LERKNFFSVGRGIKRTAGEGRKDGRCTVTEGGGASQFLHQGESSSSERQLGKIKRTRKKKAERAGSQQDKS